MKRRLITASFLVIFSTTVAGLNCADPGRTQTASKSLKIRPRSHGKAPLSADPAPPKLHALLVGCTKYDNLPGHSLKGPANDVDLMRKVLERDFSVDPKNIAVL